MALALGVILGVLIFFFLKSFAIVGPVTAGLVSGIIARGPLKGAAAGILSVFVASVIFSISAFAITSVFGDVSTVSGVTGLAIQDITSPRNLSFKTFSFGISALAIGSIGGLLGGLLNR
ncbi:MAG TPA: hypothetical protein ENN30_01195 [Candidatus Woesearchaeota archaeon]|nr:hypothetical protein [Candidatus Woesearchaeota archaeon]